MTKSILLLVAVNFILAATILSCNAPVKNVQQNVNEENIDLDEINQEYLTDIEHYRNETSKKIESNSHNITEFKSKIDAEKEACKYDYRHSIFELELYNSYMKKKLCDYKPEGKKNWQIFKKEFTRQMDELDTEFAVFTHAI